MTIPRVPGTYVLVMRCRAAGRVRIGRWGWMRLTPGWYLYAGSACGPGGLAARVGRHLRGGPKHWHVDYLRARLPVVEVWWQEGRERRECEWARALRDLPGARSAAEGFGASDCRCAGHLVWYIPA